MVKKRLTHDEFNRRVMEAMKRPEDSRRTAILQRLKQRMGARSDSFR